MKNRIAKFLVLMTFGALISCQEEDYSPVIEVESDLLEQHFKKNYHDLIIPLAKSLSNKESLDELFEFSKIEKNSGEIEVNLIDLFNNRYNTSETNSRKVNSFSHRLSKNINNDLEELTANFIIPNDIEIYAPYLAENFSGINLSSLTFTYYYEGMYGSESENPNFKGKTPGLKFHFNKNGELDLSKYETVETDDEYAMKNPTIVLLPNQSSREENEVLNTNDSKKGLINNENKVVGAPLCNQLTGVNEILTIRMPEYKLRQNFRDWPSPNEMYLWVSTGAYTTNANGTPSIGVNTANPLVGHRVSRSDASNKSWVNSDISFLVQNVDFIAKGIHVVWGCRKTDTQIDVSASIAVQADGTATPTYKISTITKSGVYLITSVVYDKCALMYNNRYDISSIPNFRAGYPVYNFNNIWTYFIVEKYNY